MSNLDGRRGSKTEQALIYHCGLAIHATNLRDTVKYTLCKSMEIWILSMSRKSKRAAVERLVELLHGCGATAYEIRHARQYVLDTKMTIGA